MEDSCYNFQWQTNSTDKQLSSMEAVGMNKHQLDAHAPLFEYYVPGTEPSPRATKQLKTQISDRSLMNKNVIHGSTLVKPKDEGFVYSMGINGFACNNLQLSHPGNQNCYGFDEGCPSTSGSGGGADRVAKVISTSNITRVSPYQDHILAERKRRETISQRFIALSALLPNLKKLDKVSVLGDAIEYMKTLKDKVKLLEEQTSKRANVKSVRFEMVADSGDISASDEKFSCVSDQLPEIEARFSGKDVLIRVHCEKKSGVVENTIAEIEKLNLSVINSTAVIFANSALHITVIAQMNKDFNMMLNDFVKNLRFGLKQFM